MFPAGLWMVMRIVRAGIAKDGHAPVEGGRPAAPVKAAPGGGS